MPRISLGRTLAVAGVLFAWSVCALGADVTSVKVTNTSSSAVSNVPVTFGQVFEPGDVPAGAVIGGRLGSTNLNLQVDKKATHRDGSLRHAVITAQIPSLAANATQTLTLINSGSAPGGGAITTSALLGTTFDATVNLSIGGTAYTASARSLLQSGTPTTWLAGPLATEWVLSAPVRTSSGTAHPHLQARFYVRAYQGLQSVRVDVVVENAWAREAGPRNYGYNAAITVAGRGTVFSESAVTHYRQSRWRRTVWWGTTPVADVTHDGDYLARTRAVPNYDPRIQIPSGQLDTFTSEFNANAKLMGIGNLNPYMPSPSGFNAIGPLPAWAAAYLISGDLRAKRVVVGYGTQAGAWPMHYREKSTDQPISIDTFPSASVLGGGFFPACGGDCNSPYTPEASHHPSLAFLPYLLTGDYYLMEETAFWGNWVLFYGESSRHGGSQGLVTWDQVRGQAWSLRTLVQAAYLLPDNHPLKSYFNAKLQNNINYFIDNWVDSNPLG